MNAYLNYINGEWLGNDQANPFTVENPANNQIIATVSAASFEQVQLVARISRSGNATAGEWIGSSQPLASKTTQLQQLLIDSADSKAP